MTKLIDITGKALAGEWGNDDETGTGIPVLRTTNFTNEGVVNYESVVTRSITKKNIEDKFLRPGDIIIEKSGGSDKQPVGRVIFYEGPENTFLFNNFTGVLRVKDTSKWFPRYVFYSLYSNYRKGGTRAYENKTTGLHNLKTDDYVSRFEVADANYSEQIKICDLLDKTTNVIRTRQQQLSALDDLIKARFVEMFGDCRINPKAWNTVELGEISDVGSSKRVFVEELRETGIPFYRGTEVGALAEGKAITPELFITQEHYEELIEATGKPLVGDLLMPSICPDGRIWVVDTEEPFYFKDGRVLWVHSISKEFDPVFLLYTLKDRIMTDYSSIASGTTFAELKIFALKQCRVFAVPMDLQKQFVSFVKQIDKSKFIVIKRSDKVINEQLQQEFRDLDHLIELAVNQSPFTEYSDKEFIFAAIISFVDEIRKSIAAINAYGIIECKLVPVPPEQVELWELNIESVWRRLISDLSKLFDRAETCGKSNCSLQQLKEFCLRPENRALFPERETDPLITAIGSLYQQYEDVISRSTRNEQVAHHDLKALRSNPPGFISLKALNELVEDTIKVVSEIGSKLFPFDVSFPSIEDYQHYYKAAIMSMLGHKEIT